MDKEVNQGTPEEIKNTPQQPEEVTTPAQQPEEKTFTQAEVNDLIKARLEREKKNQPDKDELAAFKAWKENQKTEAEKTAEAIKKAKEAQTAAESKAQGLEARYMAVTMGVKPDSVEDVIALAKGRVSEDFSLDKAIKDVISKYPLFATTKPQTTGVPTTNDGTASKDEAMLRRAMGLTERKDK